MGKSAESVERFLEILTELGVTPAELRRLYGCDPGEDLGDAVGREVGDDRDRTTELLRALEVTDRSFDLGSRVTDSGESLATVLDRYGYSLEVSTDGNELEIVAFDAVTNDIRRFRTVADPDSVRAALESTILDAAGLTTVGLVDGSTVVADRRAIDRLRAAYGDRIAPFGDPLLRSASDADGAAATTGDVEPVAPADRSDDEIDVTNDRTLEDLSALGDDDPSRRRRVDAELDDPDVEIGGGPRTSVSASSIDDIFAELEADQSDAAGDGTDDSDAGSDSLTGADPTVTVADESVDEILERATAETSFEEVAAREGEADPDEILDDADDVFDADEEADG